MNKRNKRLVSASVTATAAAIATMMILMGVVLAADEGIRPWAITSGGGTAASGDIIMRNAIGQPIAGVVMAGDAQLCTGIVCPKSDSSTTPSPTATPGPSVTPGPTATPDPKATPTPVPSGSKDDIVINEVYYLGNASSDWIEVKNNGTGTIDLSEWQFCARFDYAPLNKMELLMGEDLILQAGQIIVLRAWTDLENESDLALYENGNDFGDFNNMVDFVQWGTPKNVGRADVAQKKQIWPEVSTDVYDFVPVAGSGESMALKSRDGTSASDFSNGKQTQGAPNSGSFGDDDPKIYLPAVMK